ncbi:MAG: signal peptidase II [Clostridiales bacterium]|nr:signal peptidase II [Clostridiales bacterium]
MGEKANQTGRVWWKDSTLWLSVVFIALIAVDQLTKIWADHYFIDVLKDPYAKIKIIPGVIEICMEYNRGIAFSSFAGASMGWKLVIVIGTGLLMCALAFLFFKIDRRRALLRISLVFIVAGGLGNFIDRLIYRVWDPSTATGIRDGVRDMVRLKLIFDFGVCNFADFFIVAGAVMLILSMLFFDADAVFPVTKKYKTLAKEYEEKEAEKKAQKAQKVSSVETENENEAAITQSQENPSGSDAQTEERKDG